MTHPTTKLSARITAKLFSSFWVLLISFCFSTSTLAATKHSTDLFDYLAAEISKPQYASMPQVKNQLRWFLNNKKHLNNVIRQSEPYLYYIFKEVKERKMPSELMLLPLIESAYDPYAHSRVGAAGLWQFMPRTAEGLGIKQNWWYDGRRDVISSTQGALAYLNYLHKFFKGNWLLAIASYNCGEGRVKRAVESNKARGKKTDFWSLDLPQETKDYVPRLLALSIILRDPSRYGVDIPAVKASPYFTSIDVGQQIDLAHAAQLANISLNELYQLNPGFSRWTTDPDGPHKILLPINKASVFHNNFAKHTGKVLPTELPSWAAEIPVQKTTQLTVNHDKKFHLPQKGHLPGVSKKSSEKKTFASAQSLKKLQRYIVKAGDNLFSISNRYKVSQKAIMEANALSNDHLSINQTLYIPLVL